MFVRGIRGAITIEEDLPEKVLEGTRELLYQLVEANSIQAEDVASVLFTVTADIKSAFPARAARQLGWDKVPLMCFQEIQVPGSLALCIRVLIHLNTDKQQQDLKHIYLREARRLREDLAEQG